MRTEFLGDLRVVREPSDDDLERQDGSGTIRVTHEGWDGTWAHGVRVSVEGDYATWSLSDITAEATYMLAND